MKQLVLASSSPRRATLLQGIGLSFIQIKPELDEGRLPSESASNLVMRLARAKARVGLEIASNAFSPQTLPNLVVLAADTVIELNGAPIGKPNSRSAGVQMLMQLSGREHSVVTGFCLLSSGLGTQAKNQQGLSGNAAAEQLAATGGLDQELLSCEAVTSRVRFRSISQAEAEAYWATGEPQDKAGGYGIQGKGSIFVEQIAGSYTNIVGLPLTEVHACLVKHGIDCLKVTDDATCCKKTNETACLKDIEAVACHPESAASTSFMEADELTSGEGLEQ